MKINSRASFFFYSTENRTIN